MTAFRKELAELATRIDTLLEQADDNYDAPDDQLAADDRAFEVLSGADVVKMNSADLSS